MLATGKNTAVPLTHRFSLDAVTFYKTICNLLHYKCIHERQRPVGYN